jgi:hypothetical protein
MRTSTAEANNYVCPECGDKLTEDLAVLGFVRHKNNPNCQFEKGCKDNMPDSSNSNCTPEQ